MSPNLNKDTAVKHQGEHHGDKGETEIKLTKYNILWALCAALNSCNVGYDIGIGTEGGSMNLWAIFGALGSHYFSDRFGRRTTFFLASVIFIVGIALLAAAPDYTVLMVGRFFVGIGIGIGFAIDPLYISEVTPAKHRGELVSWSEIMTNVGLVFGFASGMIFSGINDAVQWRYMFALGGVFPLIIIFLVLFVMPESPRWLVGRGLLDEAKPILAKIYPQGFDVDPIIEDIQEAIEREAEAEHAVGWKVILRPSPAVRRMLLVGVGIAVAQMAVGIDAIQYYLLDSLANAGIESTYKQERILIGLGVIKLAFVVVGSKLFDRCGRRPLFHTSLLGMTVACSVLSAAYFVDNEHSGIMAVVGVALYFAFFSIAMGPGAWLIPSEVYATVIRAKAMSLSTFSNRLTGFLVSSTFLTTANAMGYGGFFAMLAVICLIVFAFLYIYLPETNGVSIEEMSLLFADLTGDTSILEAERQILNRKARVVDVPTDEKPEPSKDATLSDASTMDAVDL